MEAYLFPCSYCWELFTAVRVWQAHIKLRMVQVIDLGDRLKFTLGPGKKDALTSNSRFVPLGEKNLVRALCLCIEAALFACLSRMNTLGWCG
jgi:hypothetical protein